ncbi:FkbM family methyltransferase [Leptospira jelokensis]|uniref:FkbM family methyltransferase n=1 Tax=Leptospira jelokensis TaxID=2484931 RepID=UPI001090ED56|nr:FkbM family methyltransferase [Leptospira jelokensis]TGL99190.1 FkbM family methyltransferase [Leptospira jelokensis]
MFTKLIVLGFKIFNFLYSIGMFRTYLFFYDIYKYISDYSDIRRINGIIQPGSIVVDAGANVGFYTRLFSKLVGNQGLVIAFEPDEENFRILKTRTSKLDNVKIVNVALSDKSGKINLYRSKDLNVDHQTYDSGENREKIQIDCFSLDEYCTKYGIEHISFIKMDLQGYDAIALRGMKNIIKRNPSIFISCEFWPYGMLKAGIQPSEMLKGIKSMGFNTDFEFDGNSSYGNYSTLWLCKVVS